MVKKVTNRNFSRFSYLEVFLTTRDTLHLLDISRKLNENHATVRKYLSNFEKQGILKRSVKGRLTLYKLNFNSPMLVDILVMGEKDKLIRSIEKNIILKELVVELRNLTDKTLVIFGSASEDFSKANDVDILTLDKNLNVNEIEKKLNLEVHVNYVSSLISVSNVMKEEILKKHLIINNSEGIVRWLV